MKWQRTDQTWRLPAEGQAVFVHAMKEYRGVEVYRHSFFTSAVLMWSVSFMRQPLAPPPSLWRNIHWSPFKRRLNGPQSLSGRFGEENVILTLAEF
jgi:hypothetical protein